MHFEISNEAGGGWDDAHMNNVYSMSFGIFYIYIVYFILLYIHAIPKSFIYLIYLSFRPLPPGAH